MKQKLAHNALMVIALILLGLCYFLEAYKDFKKGFKEGYNQYSTTNSEIKTTNLCQ
jgi:hypothetical protein